MAGTLAAGTVPRAALLDPLTQVHCPDAGEKVHKSLKEPEVEGAELPFPPNNQKFPTTSVQKAAGARAPGTLAAAAALCVSYTPIALGVLLPLTHVH